MKKAKLIIMSILLLTIISCSKDNNSDSNIPISLCGNITDIDGNVYSSVTINNKCWITENLNVTHYRNGDPIPEVQDPTQWTNLTTGAWCYSNNNSALESAYGKLYNWHAVNDPRGLAPEGWHVPDEVEWRDLRLFLGSGFIAGAAMKETGIKYWPEPNKGATNSSGFSARPAGFRAYNGDSFFAVGYFASWWTSSPDYTDTAHLIQLDVDNFVRPDTGGKRIGLSVRCVKD